MSGVSSVSSANPLSSALISPTTTSSATLSTGSSFMAMHTTSTPTEDQINKTAQDFEAMYLSQMLEPMFSGEASSSYFGGGATGDIYRGFMMNEYGKAMAQAGGIGIASQVKQELLKLQEVQS